MKIIQSINKQLVAKSPVITWGIFDGVHRGHQALIRTLTRWARQLKRPSLVLTFNEHPRKVLLAHDQPLFITSLAHRLMLLKQLGVDYCLVLPFTKQFSRMPAQEFITDFLVRKINPSGIVLTAGTVFGNNRQGDVRMLKKLSSIPVKVVPPKLYQNRVVSSTLIRRAIQDNRLKEAGAMLGRKVSILGTVVKGDRRGRTLGFPTANLDPHHEILPPSGVYLACARLTANGYHHALVNIGSRPTFHNAKNIVIEVYLLNYHGFLYGKDLEVTITRYLRPEKRFPSSDALIRQIKSDIACARRLGCK